MNIDIVDTGTPAISSIPNGHNNPSLASSKPKKSNAVPRKGHRGKSSGEDWELDCEICGSKGLNRDDGVPLMSCGKCSKWQHIQCHDKADAQKGRPPRNWNVVDFTCRACLSRQGVTSGKRNKVIAHQSTLEVNAPYPGSGYPRHPSLVTAPSVIDPRLSSLGSGSYQEARLAINGQKTPANYNYQPYSQKSAEAQVRSPAEDVLIPATSKRAVPHQSNASVTFAHYQPLQRGFSPHPTALQTRLLQDSSSSQSAHIPYSNGADYNGVGGWNQRSHHFAHSPQGYGGTQSVGVPMPGVQQAPSKWSNAAPSVSQTHASPTPQAPAVAPGYPPNIQYPHSLQFQHSGTQPYYQA